MIIKCADCCINLGKIRDAKLRKNIAHLCNVCDKKRRDNITKLRIRDEVYNPLDRLFGKNNLFN